VKSIFESQELISKGHYHSEECDACRNLVYGQICQFVADLINISLDKDLDISVILNNLYGEYGIDPQDVALFSGE